MKRSVLRVLRARSSSRRAAVFVVALLGACDVVSPLPAFDIAGGHADRGPALIRHYGCGACHRIPGVDAADGNVGPPLAGFADRVYIAGMLRNEPENLMRWIRDPQRIVPGNAMPDLGVNEQDARDIAAYLYKLR